ncbi:Ig-like domain-containing protein [Actinoplanes sp. NPDC049599]|uniref:Ig-like domain-containing protein n=1 Tax=Actinoplanes sp. NPDC049599 TaxID=3363903 RepID=UPI00379907A2
MIFRRAAACLAVAVVVAATPVLVTAAPAAAVPVACTSAGLTVTALHGPNFYVDTSSSPVLRGAYAGYRVTDTTGNPRTDLWVELGDFTGGSVTLGSGQPAAQQVATLAGSASASRFFYLTALAESATAQRHSVAVWRGRPDLPGSAQLCADSGGFTAVEGTIKAAANKLTSVTVSTGTPKIGGTFTVTVAGDTGTIGAGSSNDPSSFWMSPAASGSWPAGAYRLVGTSLSFSDGAGYTDTLRVSGLSSASKAYTAVYTFRAVGFTSSPTSVLPVQQIASGTQIKHTDLGSVATLPAIAPSSNDMTVALTADAQQLPHTGGTVTYQATMSGSAGAVLDAFAATVPAGATLVPGSVTWRGAPAPDGVGSGTIVLQGPFTITGSGDVLTFTLALPATSGDRVTSVVATVGSATIDTTLALTDNAPATRTVNVNTFPAAAGDAVVVSDNQTSTLTLTGNDTDADGDTLAVTAVGTAGYGTAALVSGAVSYTPDGGYTGADTFTYTVSDGRGGTDTATVTVTVVTPSGPPPQATADPATATAGTPAPIDVLGNDTGQELTVTAVSTPGHGTAEVTGGGTGVAYTAAVGYTGTDTFTYTVRDLGGVTAVATVTVTVSAPAPVAPPAALVATADQADTDAGTSVTLTPLDNDTGDGPLGVQSVGIAGHGTVSVTGDAVTYVPAADFWGTDSFTYTVADVHAAVATGAVTVTVAAGPAPADDSATIGFDAATDVDVLANDPSGAVLAEVVTGPAHGTATVDGTVIRYTPAEGHSGSDVFTYRLVGAPDAATVQLTVIAPTPTSTPPTTSPTTAAPPVLPPARPPRRTSPAPCAGVPSASTCWPTTPAPA